MSCLGIGVRYASLRFLDGEFVALAASRDEKLRKRTLPEVANCRLDLCDSFDFAAINQIFDDASNFAQNKPGLIVGILSHKTRYLG